MTVNWQYCSSLNYKPCVNFHHPPPVSYCITLGQIPFFVLLSSLRFSDASHTVMNKRCIRKTKQTQKEDGDDGEDGDEIVLINYSHISPSYYSSPARHATVSPKKKQ